MKYFLLIFFIILSGCHLDRNFVNLNKVATKQSTKENKNSNILSDIDFKKMSFDEFDLFLKKYSKNLDHPDIKN